MKHKESKMSTRKKVCSVMNLNRNQIKHHTKCLCSTVTKGQVGGGGCGGGWRDYFFLRVKKPLFLCSSLPESSVRAGSVWERVGMLAPSPPVTELIRPIHVSLSFCKEGEKNTIVNMTLNDNSHL